MPAREMGAAPLMKPARGGVHKLPSSMLSGPIKVVVVGCGGTGSAVAFGLPYLHQALLAFGHPYGLEVTLVDGDVVSETNCVRQPFSRAEIGLNKAIVIATRINLFWGLHWQAIPQRLGEVERYGSALVWDAPTWCDLVIGCVDTRTARREILNTFERGYWLDFGNDAETGQFCLGELRAPQEWTQTKNGRMDVRPARPRLPHAADLWPESVAEGEEDDAPSCSAAEALTRQAPYVNQVLAQHGLALLSQLFRYGEIRHHGGFVNLRDGRVIPIPVPDEPAPTPAPKKNRRTRKARAAATA